MPPSPDVYKRQPLSQRIISLVSVAAAITATAVVAARTCRVLTVEAHALHPGHQRTGRHRMVQITLCLLYTSLAIVLVRLRAC